MSRRILTPNQWRQIDAPVRDSVKRFVPTVIATVPAVINGTVRRVWSTGTVRLMPGAISWSVTDRRF